MNFTHTRAAETASEKELNESFYPTNRTQAQHNEMLRRTLPEQRSGRVKLTCGSCAQPIGCTELLANVRPKSKTYRHLRCPA